MTVRILPVCTGNICRSPMAMQLLRMQLDPQQFSLASAGVAAVDGAPMDPISRLIAEKLGVPDAGEHVARQLTRHMVAEADLVLALTLEHRRQIVELRPAAAKYTFTLREFARIVDEVPDAEFATAVAGARQPVRAALKAVVSHRGLLPPAAPSTLDVVDPYGRSARVHEKAAAEVAPAVNSIARFFARSISGFPPES